MLKLQEKMKTKLLKKMAIMLIDNKIFQVVGVLLIAAFTLGFLSGAYTEYTLTKNKIVSEVYTVKQGDTFMDICVEYQKRDFRNPYILEYMDEIRRLNTHIDTNLKVGDELKIQYREKVQ